MEPKRVSIATLGCKLNLVDTEEIVERLAEHGYTIVPFGREADVTIINTCTVTAKSDFKSRRLISKAHRSSPDALVVVTGCYAQLDPDRISTLRGVHLVVGHSQQDQIPKLLLDLPRTGTPTVRVDGWSHPPKRKIRHRTTLSRAFLRVQNGCNQRCTFCRVWKARGSSVSEPLDDVVAQAQVFLDQGYEELVLTGIDMGSWGKDLPGGMNFGTLLGRLADLPGTFRIRLSSIYPIDITDRVFELVTSHSRLCRHLHLPLQSGSTAILQRMGRHVSQDEFMQLTWRLRDAAGRMGMGVDIIAGFPGETESDFHATMRLIDEAAITYLHVFPFSPRDGTRAAEFRDQLDPEIIRERARELRALGYKKREEFRASHTGPAEILVERRRDSKTGLLTGFTSDYLRAHFTGPDDWMGKLVRFDRLPEEGGKVRARPAQ